MAQSFTNLLDKIKELEYKFVNQELINHIGKCISELFPQLNKMDINVLNILTVFVVDLISFKK